MAQPQASDLPLVVNGEARSVALDSTVEALLQVLELDGKRIAVAVNRDVIPRSAFRHHRLCAGDRVEILEAVGGG